MENVKTFLEHLTTQPGVYQMLDEKGRVIYVGKARNLKKRLTSYFQRSPLDAKTTLLVKLVKDIQVTVTSSEVDALLLECNLIKSLKPRLNVLLRDDKSYPYIVITQTHPFPRIDFYRGLPRTGNLYFGPYPHIRAVRETIKLIQKLFKLRTCDDSFYQHRSRPCLQYQIGRCSGPCVDLITEEEYRRNVQHAILFLQGKSDLIVTELEKQMLIASQQMNYELATLLRDQITHLREIQAKQYVSRESGQQDIDVIGLAFRAGMAVIQLLAIRGGRMLGSYTFFPVVPLYATETDVMTAFIVQHYLQSNKINTTEIPEKIVLGAKLAERTLLANALSHAAGHSVLLVAAIQGDSKRWAEMAEETAKQAIATHLSLKLDFSKRFVALQQELNLPTLPERLECFDISHTQGEATIASCVVFNAGGPAKSLYRRFRIENIIPGDDYAAMYQALTRRYKRILTEEGTLPDILFIDGGKGQLSEAKKVLAELEITKVLIIGIAKGEGRKPGLETLFSMYGEVFHLASDSLALHLVQHIRDEAHRFAIVAHRKARAKKRNTSILESIPGVGSKRRRALLQFFGGIQALHRASLEQIAKVAGIDDTLARKIYEILHISS